VGYPQSAGAGRWRRGSNNVSSLPAPTLRRAIRHPKFAQALAFVLHDPRSTRQEGFEHSLITSTLKSWSRECAGVAGSLRAGANVANCSHTAETGVRKELLALFVEDVVLNARACELSWVNDLRRSADRRTTAKRRVPRLVYLDPTRRE
jgi:hypothetical protein